MPLFGKKEDVARIYQGLSSSQTKKLRKAGVEEWLAKGTPVFRKGQAGKEMYIIIDGAVRIVDDTVTPPKDIATLRQGELFGELSLSARPTRRASKTDSPRRSATAFAGADTMLFVVHEDVFRRLLEHEPDIASKLLMNLFYITGERLRESIRDKVIAEGAPMPKLIKGLKDAEKRKLLKFSGVLHATKGQPIFMQGQVGSELYYILSGAVEIVKKEAGQRKKLALLAEGDIFGELGLATRKARMASAVAVADSELLVMSEEELIRLRRKSPEIATKLLLNLFGIVTARMRALVSPLGA